VNKWAKELIRVFSKEEFQMAKKHMKKYSPSLVINIDEDVRKKNPPTLLVGMQISSTTIKNNMEVSQKTKHREAILPTNSTLMDIPQGI
jgi:hypothetical protein